MQDSRAEQMTPGTDALAEDPNLILTTTWWLVHNHLVARAPIPSSGLPGHRAPTCYTDTRTDKALTHVIILRVSIVVLKYHDQRQPREKGFISSSTSRQ